MELGILVFIKLLTSQYLLLLHQAANQFMWSEDAAARLQPSGVKSTEFAIVSTPDAAAASLILAAYPCSSSSGGHLDAEATK